MQIRLKRLNNNFKIEAKNEDGNALIMDASKDIGGNGEGMRPMQLLLAALGGCSTIDIILILKKQKQEVESLEIEVNGDRQKNESEDVSLFKTIDVHFIFKGNLDSEKVNRAVKLSMEKYCSVSKTLEPTANITYRITLN